LIHFSDNPGIINTQDVNSHIFRLNHIQLIHVSTKLYLYIKFIYFSGTLEGERQRPNYQDLINDPMLKFSGAYQEGHSDLYVTCRIYSDGRPLSLAVSTLYKAFSTRWK
jgi:hypothetical protein